MTNERKRIFKLALANHTFGDAQALIHHQTEQKLDPTSPYYPGIAAGIVITYLRPFEDADNLGPLSQSFQKFPPGEKAKTGHSLAELHEEMKRMRYRLFAHYDLDRIPELTRHMPRPLPPDHLEFTVAQGRVCAKIVSTLPEPIVFTGASDLITFQRGRVMDALHEQLRHWLKSMPKDGEYMLTDRGLDPVP